MFKIVSLGSLLTTIDGVVDQALEQVLETHPDLRFSRITLDASSSELWVLRGYRSLAKVVAVDTSAIPPIVAALPLDPPEMVATEAKVALQLCFSLKLAASQFIPLILQPHCSLLSNFKYTLLPYILEQASEQDLAHVLVQFEKASPYVGQMVDVVVAESHYELVITLLQQAIDQVAKCKQQVVKVVASSISHILEATSNGVVTAKLEEAWKEKLLNVWTLSLSLCPKLAASQYSPVSLSLLRFALKKTSSPETKVHGLQVLKFALQSTTQAGFLHRNNEHEQEFVDVVQSLLFTCFPVDQDTTQSLVFPVLLKGVLQQVEQTGSVALFKSLYHCLKYGDTHKHAGMLAASLRRLSLDVDLSRGTPALVVEAFRLVVAPQGQREEASQEVVFQWFMVPLLRRLRVFEQWKGLLATEVCGKTILKVLIEACEGSLKSDISSKTSCCLLCTTVRFNAFLLCS